MVPTQGKVLSTIVREVPIRLDLRACQVSHYDRDEVARLFQELEFTKLLSRLPETKTDSRQPSAVTCHIVNTRRALQNLVGELEGARDVAIGIQTTSGRATSTDLMGIAISPIQGNAYYAPLAHQGLDQPQQLPLSEVAPALKTVLGSATIGKIAFDGKHAMTALAGHGVKLENVRFDCMLAAHLLGEKSLGLKGLAFNRLGVEISTPEELSSSRRRRSSSGPSKARTLPRRRSRSRRH